MTIASQIAAQVTSAKTRFQGTVTAKDKPLDRCAYSNIIGGNYNPNVSFVAGTGNTTGDSTGSICVLYIYDSSGNLLVCRKATVDDAAEYPYQYAICGVDIV